jgi:hypothetical protein
VNGLRGTCPEVVRNEMGRRPEISRACGPSVLASSDEDDEDDHYPGPTGKRGKRIRRTGPPGQEMEETEDFSDVGDESTRWINLPHGAYPDSEDEYENADAHSLSGDERDDLLARGRDGVGGAEWICYACSR